MRTKKLMVLGGIIFTLINAVPRIISYEGKLLDSFGVGINDTINITFRLYTSATDGTPVWEENINNVVVSKGLFNVLLGSRTPFPDSVDFSQPYWMEIQIGDEVLAPRERLSSVPYSIRAESVDKALRSVSSSVDRTGRFGHIMYVPFSGSTITESSSGDTIYIAVGGSAIAGVSSITGAGAIYPNFRASGDVILSARVDNTTIAINDSDRLAVRENGITSRHIQDSTITGQDIATHSISMRNLADFSITSPARGSILYFDGSQWVNLPPGSDGQVLTSHGSTAPPSWTTPVGGGEVSFTLYVEPTEGLVARNDTIYATINAALIAGEPSEITFGALGLPSGTIASFLPPACTPSGSPPTCSSTLEIITSPTTPVGTRTVTITGRTSTGAIGTTEYTLRVGSVPGTITDLNAVGGARSIILTWSEPDNGGFPITGYEIYRGESPDPTTRIASVAPSYTYVDSVSLLAGVLYYYRVRAVNSAGGGGYSNNAYASIIVGACSTFTFTGDYQRFIVPEGVSSVSIEAWGAQGSSGGSGGGLGGRGGYAGGSIHVSPGQVLYVCVGGQNGWYNGGSGGGGSRPGGSGGGASYVSVGRTSIAYAVIIAGGGGGGGGVGQTAGPGGTGGSGGGTVAQAGTSGGSGGRGATGGGGGGGGTGSSGGAEGSGSVSGLPGMYGAGGNGGDGWNSSYSGSGGGGGGGYFGGGGGGGGSYVYYGYESPYNFGGSGGGGGGGSSFVDTTAVRGSSTVPGVRSGNGLVIICW